MKLQHNLTKKKQTKTKQNKTVTQSDKHKNTIKLQHNLINNKNTVNLQHNPINTKNTVNLQHNLIHTTKHYNTATQSDEHNKAIQN